MTGHEDDNSITHVVVGTIPTEALLEELLTRFEKENRSFVIGYEIKTEDGGDTTSVKMGGAGNNAMRFYLSHCVLDWVKKRACLGFKDEDE